MRGFPTIGTRLGAGLGVRELVAEAPGRLPQGLEASRRGESVCVRTSRARRREIAEWPAAKAGTFFGGFSAA